MSTVRSLPRRPNSGWSATCTNRNRSPSGPPLAPAPPLPLIRIRCPSWTPAGTRTLTVWVAGLRPWPRHVSHGVSTIMPRPPHLLHGSVMANTPPDVLFCIPLPSHSAQTLGAVPGFAPLPGHFGHASSLDSRSGIVAPSTACSQLIEASDCRSSPRRARVRLRPPPLPYIPPRRSDRSKSIWVAPACVPYPPPGRPNPPPKPLPPKPPPKRLNISCCSSYSLRFSGFDSTA